MNIRHILNRAVQSMASDLHIKAGTAPTIRIDGRLFPLDEPQPSSQDLDTIVEQILTPKQRQQFEEVNEIDFAFSIPGLARFRANFYRQRGTVAMAFGRENWRQGMLLTGHPGVTDGSNMGGIPVEVPGPFQTTTESLVNPVPRM